MGAFPLGCADRSNRNRGESVSVMFPPFSEILCACFDASRAPRGGERVNVVHRCVAPRASDAALSYVG